MDPEDALLCLEAHATSKIKNAQDISKIVSFGFRGEALPSIASICRLELRTRAADYNQGTEVLVEGGVIKNVNDVGCAPGTSVVVKTIFYNLPARRKFLRNTKTEEFHIQETVLLSALANPGVAFQLTLDSRPVIAVQPSNDLKTRASMVLGKEMMASMVPVEFGEENIKIEGYVARPGLSRTSRRDQRTFVNGRPVEANSVYHAIRDAYHTLVMKGRYPPCVLFLTIDPELIDINVHPAKREVRFHNDRLVGRMVGNAIRRALQNTISPPDITPDPVSVEILATSIPRKISSSSSSFPKIRTSLSNFANELPGMQINRERSENKIPSEEPSLSVGTSFEREESFQPSLENQQSAFDGNSRPGTSISSATREAIKGLRVLGAISDLFLVAEGKEGMVLIDQHAAHERILFEKVLQQARSKDGIRQGLLIPITIEFSGADARILRDNLEGLGKLGFEIEDFGGNTFIINSVPAHFPQVNLSAILRDIIDELQDSPLRSRRADEEKIAQMACKAAVKAHDHLSKVEVSKLLEDLVITELPFTCPHGRPTMINISFKELEKRFGRRS